MIVSILLMATIFGTIINSFSLFTRPVGAELTSITIRDFSYAYSVITFIAIPVAPFVGALLKKMDARWVVSLGVGFAVLANVLLSQAQNIWWIYAAAALQGIAVTLATTIPISVMVTNWFTKMRGTALGIATAGSGLGSLIFVPLIQFFLLPTFGWRGAYLALAAIQVLLLIPLSILVLRTSPERKGLLPLGAEAPAPVIPLAETPASAVPAAAAGIAAPRPGLTQGQVFRSPAFWLLGAALIFSGVSVNGMISNLVPMLGTLRASEALIGLILSTLGLFVMLGKFLTGVLFDRMNLMLAIILVSAANAAQFFFMLSPTNAVNSTLFSFLHGFGATMVTVTPAYLAAKLFGERDYASVYSYVSIFAMAGAGIAPIFGGFFFGGQDSSTATHATTLVWAWLVMGVIGLGLYIVTVLAKPKWEVADEPVRHEAG